MRSSATYWPSWFFSGTRMTWPSAYSEVQAVRVFSIRSGWSRQMNERWAFLIIAPGSRCVSQRIWKPLQMPSTGMPPFAASTTFPMTGAKPLIAPARR